MGTTNLCILSNLDDSAVPVCQNSGEHHIGASGSKITRVKCPGVVDVANHSMSYLWRVVFILIDVGPEPTFGRKHGNICYWSAFHGGWR